MSTVLSIDGHKREQRNKQRRHERRLQTKMNRLRQLLSDVTAGDLVDYSTVSQFEDILDTWAGLFYIEPWKMERK